MRKSVRIQLLIQYGTVQKYFKTKIKKIQKKKRCKKRSKFHFIHKKVSAILHKKKVESNKVITVQHKTAQASFKQHIKPFIKFFSKEKLHKISSIYGAKKNYFPEKTQKE